MTNAPDRCLVIGSGSIARRHIANLRELFPKCEVGCVSASGRTLAATETAASVRFDTLDAALDAEPAFVVVASPAPLHLPHALACVRRGLAVLLEKPLATSMADFLVHAEELHLHRHRIAVGYNLRHLPSAQRMRDLLHEGAVGQPSSITIDLGQYLPDWRPNEDYRRGVSANFRLGGGVLLELSHEFDYLTWLFGRFDTLYGLISNSGTLEVDVEDTVDLLMSRASGLVAHLHMDFLQRRATRRCKVIGKNGNLIWDLIENSIAVETGTGTELVFAGAAYDRNEMYRSQLLQFSNVARGEATPIVDLESAVYTLKLIEAARSSAATRQPVALERSRI